MDTLPCVRPDGNRGNYTPYMIRECMGNIYIYMYIHIRACLCIYMCIDIYVYIDIYIYLYMNRTGGEGSLPGKNKTPYHPKKN